jgi:hypothetical protein
MAEGQETVVRPVSRGRRITGIVLIGCRLVYRSRAAAWAAVLWVVAGFGMVYVHDHWLR